MVGEALVDVVLGADGRMDPVPGGAPYNVARTIGRLGGPVSLATALSTDRFGVMLRAGLEESGVDTSLVAVSARPTPRALAELDAAGAASYRFSLAGTSLSDVVAPSVAPGTAAVVTGGLVLAVPATAATIVSMLDAAPPGTWRVVDLNVRSAAAPDGAEAYRVRLRAAADSADLVKASVDDVAFVVPGLGVDEAARQLVEDRAGPARGGTLVVTDGGGSVRVFVPGERVVVEVPAADVVDTIGAGDAFVGGVVEALTCRGVGPDAAGDLDAVEFAVRAGVAVSTCVVGRRGADPPRRADLDGRWPDGSHPQG